MMIRLPRLPSAMLHRIPGPPPFGSRQAVVQWGMPYYPFIGQEGLPDGQMILDTWNNTGQPTWFAMSDYGAGFIPWGFWQVVFYPTGTSSHQPTTLAYQEIEVADTTTSSQVASLLQGALSVFQGMASFLYPNVRGFRFAEVQMNPDTPGPGTAGVTITCPWGLNHVANYYSGDVWGTPPEHFPMVAESDGYDNPLMMALWGPGQRAVLPCSPVGDLPKYPYPGYPYPGQPYFEHIIG